METQIKHFENLTNKSLLLVKTGEYFTYKCGVFFRKGLKVSNIHMIDIGLFCNSKEAAQQI